MEIKKSIAVHEGHEAPREYYLQDRCIIILTLCLRPSSCFYAPRCVKLIFLNISEISHTRFPREAETAHHRAHRRLEISQGCLITRRTAFGNFIFRGKMHVYF